MKAGNPADKAPSRFCDYAKGGELSSQIKSENY
jgi:hypothetical protein